MNAGSVQLVRGFNDILPKETVSWRWLEGRVRHLLEGYGYQEIRLPLLEATELFARSIGASTDIVEKEMYTFDDKGGGSLSLRPEGTAGCVRAGITHGLFHQRAVQRLWYSGPMFRHERPQKGRYRQFHQMGAEAFGIEGPEIETEMLAMLARLWSSLGLQRISLKLNSLGTPASRERFRRDLVDYLGKEHDRLDADSQRRLHTNPLRILDSKDEGTQALLARAPQLSDYLDEESKSHFSELCSRLESLKIPFTVDPHLVRGLDYYTRTVFEWTTDALGAQDAICSGGRYDGLVEQLGGPQSPAIGWALGMERLLLLMEVERQIPQEEGPDVYCVLVGQVAERAGIRLSERLRDQVPGLRMILNMSQGSFRAQLRRADRSGAQFALIMGENEANAGVAAVKPLRAPAEQIETHWEDLPETLNRLIGSAEDQRQS